MGSDGPSKRYYDACCGSWCAPVSLVVRDPFRLAASNMSWKARLSVRILAGWPRWLGRVHMHTTVAFQGEHQVRHTTTFRWLGLPLQRTEEHVLLDPDGSRLTVSGSMSGSGVVNPVATRARYRLRWLGADIRQHTRREPNRVIVHQEGPGFSGVQVLERQ